MTKTIFGKIMWIGRATTFVVGLAVIVALLLGAATTALVAVPGDPFKLGKSNAIDKISSLVGSVDNAMLRVINTNTGSSATALDLRVKPGKAPMKVNSGTKVANLNADQVDGQDASAFLTKGGKAADSDKLDGLDANGLNRVVFDRTSSIVLVGEDGTMASEAITAPTDGFLVISASANVRNDIRFDGVNCDIRVDDIGVTGSNKVVELDGDQIVNRRDICATDAVAPVAAGTHRVDFEATGVSSDFTSLSTPSLWAIFVPFDGEGEPPDQST